MSGITTQSIKELRERTSAGMSDCKSALVESEGDMEKAVEIILKKGLAKSAKRAGAVASEGEVRSAVAADGKSASIIEVNIQTDFAARNDNFQQFVGDVMKAALAAKTGDDLKAAPLAGKTIGDVVIDLTAKIGEKIDVRRWDRVEVPAGKHGIAYSYNHMGGKIGVIIAIEAETDTAAQHAEAVKFAEDTAMQIAAMNPLYLHKEHVDADHTAKQREIFEGQLREDPKPKPEAAWPKIIEGKVAKWHSEIVLHDQESVVVPGKKIAELVDAAGKAAGGKLQIIKFVRFERGEGIEKKEDNFAAEVAKMASE